MLAQRSFQFRPSKILAAYLLLLFVLSSLSILLSALSVEIQVVLLLLLAVYAGFIWRHLVTGFAAHQVSAVSFANRRWQLSIAGEEKNVELVSSMVWPFLLASKFREASSGRPYNLLVMKDSCDQQSFRRLSILLASNKCFAKQGD